MKTFNRKSLLFVFLFVSVLFSSCKKETTQGPTTEERYPVTNSDVMNIGGIIAKQIYNSKNLQLKSTNASEAIDKVFPVGEDSVMYVINYKNHNGFTILSGDKATTPVIMYSESGTINPDSVSDAFIAWVAQSKSFIEFNKTHLPREKKIGIKKIWDDLLAGQTYMIPSSEKLTKTKSTTTDVLPAGYARYGISNLLTTTWEQGCTYNANCPEVNDGPCGHAYAGCVATAVAQVMNYWKYPASYDWSNMLPDYGTSETARLMYDVGKSVNMSYGGQSAGGSSATTSDAVNALINTFGYANTATYGGYNLSSVITCLQNRWPVIMRGSGDFYTYYTGIWPFRTKHTVYTKGHCWVCSGCLNFITNVNGTQADFWYLWMNWGWGTTGGNGWCLNTADHFYGNGSLTFQYNVCAIYNIHP
jgi:hypothetical protein